MTIQEAYQQLLLALYNLYDNREAANIADLVIEQVTGLRRIDRFMHKNDPLAEPAQQQLEGYTRQLLQHRPVQYVLHEAWFAGLPFYVDGHVLIPRPETEELVDWIGTLYAPTQNEQQKAVQLLDVGTGSGCIPIALKTKFNGWQVHALDVSAGALQVAQKNATALGVAVNFYLADILNPQYWQALPVFDVIVSNPPYIRQSEEADMRNNVTGFEPHTALFVPDEDALLFYRQITAFAAQHLTPGGRLFFEINESFGAEVCALLAGSGFTNVTLKQDMQGKDRMVMGCKP